jgi:hypothetical protein
MRVRLPPASAARHHALTSSGTAEGDGTELADDVLPFPPEGFCFIKYLRRGVRIWRSVQKWSACSQLQRMLLLTPLLPYITVNLYGVSVATSTQTTLLVARPCMRADQQAMHAQHSNASACRTYSAVIQFFKKSGFVDIFSPTVSGLRPETFMWGGQVHIYIYI